MKWDLEAGRTQAYSYEPHLMPEEHVFVPRPRGRAEDDGWLVGTALDIRDRVTTIQVFDAMAVNDGPVAIGRLPYPLPLGFHGNFVAA